jgi:hypothetical protein
MEEYDSASSLEEVHDEEVETNCPQSLSVKLFAMRKLKENAKQEEKKEKEKEKKEKKEKDNPPTRYDKELAFRKRCKNNPIPYIEENKSHIEIILSAGLLVLQTYILSSITIMNMVHSSILENKAIHDMLDYLMEWAIKYQHYCIRLSTSHEIANRLKTVFDPYKSVKMPGEFNKKLDVIYEKALDKYMESLLDEVDPMDPLAEQ